MRTRLSRPSVAILGSLVLLGWSVAQQRFDGPPPVTPFQVTLAAQDQGEYAESRLCVRCHSDFNESLGSTPHGSDAFEQAATHGCQSCHGPGRAHVQNPRDEANWPRMDCMTVAERRDMCLGCHADFSDHANTEVACATCHAVHE